MIPILGRLRNDLWRFGHEFCPKTMFHCILIAFSPTSVSFLIEKNRSSARKEVLLQKEKKRMEKNTKYKIRTKSLVKNFSKAHISEECRSIDENQSSERLMMMIDEALKISTNKNSI